MKSSIIGIATVLFLYSVTGLANGFKAPSTDVIRDHLYANWEKYRGVQGYIAISNELFNQSMGLAYSKVSSALNHGEFKNLGWCPAYNGGTENFLKEEGRLFPNGKLDPEYRGMDGLVAYAERYYLKDKQRDADGSDLPAVNMRMPYLNSLAVLSPYQRRELGWRSFMGTTQEFRRDRSLLLLGEEMNPEFVGAAGYLKFAETYSGDMSKAYNNASVVLGPVYFRQLEWRGEFRGSAEKFQAVREALRKKRNGRPTYEGTDGYLAFAEEFFPHRGFNTESEDYAGGDMHKAYVSASATMPKADFEDLNWRGVYQGTTHDFIAERDRLRDDLKAQRVFAGEDGYNVYAHAFYPGRNMKSPWTNAKVALTKEEFDELEWPSAYHVNSDALNDERERLFENGVVRDEYRGPEGYAKFADEYHNGLMRLTFLNVSSQLDVIEMNTLNWIYFPGATNEYRRMRDRLLESDGNPNSRYHGPDGYARFANDETRGQMIRAWEFGRALLTDDEFESLAWRKIFSGSTHERNKLRAFVQDSEGKMDFQKWYGKKTGLSALVIAYMESIHIQPPHKPNRLIQLRSKFRSAMSEDELAAFGWNGLAKEPNLPDSNLICRAFPK